MSKMGFHDPFGHFKHKLWPKEGSGVTPNHKKVKNWPDFLVCRWRVTYHWKSFDEGYNFASYFILIRGLHTKLWAPKVMGVPILGISGLPFESPVIKWHLGACPVAMHRVYYKGEGGGFPQVQAMVNLVSLCLPVASSCTKMFQLCTNQLVVWLV